MAAQTGIERGSQADRGKCAVYGRPTKSALGVCNRRGACLRAYQRENRRCSRRALENVEALKHRAAEIWAPSWPQALAYFRREYPRLTERRTDLAALRLIAVFASYAYVARGLARRAAWGAVHGVLSGKRPPARPTQAGFLRAFRPRVARIGGRISAGSLRRWRRLYAEGGPDLLVDHRGRPVGLGGAQLPPDLWRSVLRGLATGRSLVKLLPKLGADLKARGLGCPALRTLQQWTAPFRLLRLHPKQTPPRAGALRTGSNQHGQSGAGCGGGATRNAATRTGADRSESLVVNAMSQRFSGRPSRGGPPVARRRGTGIPRGTRSTE
jgi:hypothetical protein